MQKTCKANGKRRGGEEHWMKTGMVGAPVVVVEVVMVAAAVAVKMEIHKYKSENNENLASLIHASNSSLPISVLSISIYLSMKRLDRLIFIRIKMGNYRKKYISCLSFFFEASHEGVRSFMSLNLDETMSSARRVKKMWMEKKIKKI